LPNNKTIILVIGNDQVEESGWKQVRLFLQHQSGNNYQRSEVQPLYWETTASPDHSFFNLPHMAEKNTPQAMDAVGEWVV